MVIPARLGIILNPAPKHRRTEAAIVMHTCLSGPCLLQSRSPFAIVAPVVCSGISSGNGSCMGQMQRSMVDIYGCPIWSVCYISLNLSVHH